jgi:hypothetical protein
VTADQIQCRRALRLATFEIHWARTDFDCEVAKYHRAQAARALRSALNVAPVSMFHRKQAG